ncbi:hypothetical protein EDB87DRAFT_1693212 [Lactarius vividus]|nr:hypothetical protein EDB87DRAFT_1693212 [Lactarius vividus]
MALQIVEAYDKTCNNPYKISPGEFYKKLLKVKIDTITRAATIEATNNTLDTSNILQQVREDFLKDNDKMVEINNMVKQAIFTELNKEAMDNINTWQEIYHEEFKEVMHQYIGVNKFDIDPCFINVTS